jgi:signal transduction histidine kinase
MGRTAAAGSVDLDAIANRLPDGYTLVSGRDRAGKKAFERDVRDSFILAVAIVVTASLGVGLALNLVMAKRVQMIADTAARIAGGDLSARAAVSARGNAFDQISDSLNAMLDRIEQLMTEMRMVTDSLAHDLRAPLTRARTAVEIALEPTSAEEERSQALEYARTQLDHVLSTFTALLDIARAEAGLSRELMQPVRLDALAEELAELFSPVIEDAGQQLVMGHVEPLVITAHAALLRQAVGNLLFNAARHAGDGAEVTLGARTADAFAEIAVADTGRGVPQDQLGRLAQRFVTLDGARGQSGSGLGLAIAGAAAKLHGGELLLQDNRPGLRAVLRLRRD